MKKFRILLLGGTAQARELSGVLADDPGLDLTVSLKGITEKPQPHGGRLISGGFGGAAGLYDYFVENRIQACINATHPFAAVMSENAHNAAGRVGIAYLRVKRPPWTRRDGDRWIEVETMDAAIAAIAPGATAFLALGSQGSGAFAVRGDARFLIRTADPVAPERRWANADYVIGLPNHDVEAEAALMQARGVSVLVARNSGGGPGYAKIAAARLLDLPVVMIGPPLQCAGERVENCAEALKWLNSKRNMSCSPPISR